MIISILNQKGGSGKTTIATNMAYKLSFDKKVVIVDSDPQGSARDWSNEKNGKILTVIGLDGPSLSQDISSLVENYDHIIIDGPPQLSSHTAAAIRVSDIVLIPVMPSPYDLWAIADLADSIKTKQELGSKLKAYILISRAIKNTNIAQDIKNIVIDYGLPLLSAQTTQRIAYPNSAANGETVFHTNDKKAQQEINAIIKELGL